MSRLPLRLSSVALVALVLLGGSTAVQAQETPPDGHTIHDLKHPESVAASPSGDAFYAANIGAKLVDCYEWIDESESERSLIMQASAARRTVEESSFPRDGALSVNDEETLHPHK
jgi:hypothetical protein